MRRPLLLACGLAALTAFLRRRATARQAEKDLWTEATAPPVLDLR